MQQWKHCGLDGKKMNMNTPYKLVIALGFIVCLMLFALFKTQAQISDFTIAKPEFESSLTIIHRVIDEPQCLEEYGYVTLPDTNHLIVFDLTIINMGQHDAGFPNMKDSLGNFLPDSVLAAMGLHFNRCHWHVHAEGFFVIYLEDVCGNVIDSSAKIGFNLHDMGNIMRYLQTPNGYRLNTWLLQYGTPNYLLEFHPPNTSYNGDTRMGLSAANFDTYSSHTWGNSIPLHPAGDYFMRPVLDPSRWFNEGFNIFPNTFRTPITITPQGTINTYAHTTVCAPALPDTIPSSIVATVIDQQGQNDIGNGEVTISGVDFPIEVRRHWVRGANRISVGYTPIVVYSNVFVDNTKGEFVWKCNGVISNTVKIR